MHTQYLWLRIQVTIETEKQPVEGELGSQNMNICYDFSPKKSSTSDGSSC